MAAISVYKKSKQKKNSQRKCGAYGYEYHEKKECPARGKTCSVCNKPNHFAKVCRSKENEKKDITGIVVAIMHVVSSSTANASTLPKLYVQVQHSLIKEGIPLETVADAGAQVTMTGPF